MTLQAAVAQNADQTADGDDSTLTYPADFFAQYSPVSVNDMLDRIPGIQLVLDFNESSIGNNADRGLGATSQILIDGRRLAGKANEAQNQLNRIAATEVDYIEIVRGSSSSLDVQNTGTLVNIVLLEAQSRSSLSTEVGMRHFTDGNVEPEARLSITGQRGRFNYLVSGDMNPGYRIEDTLELSIYPDGSFNEIVNLERETDQTNYNFNANMSWDFTPRDRLALNALFGESDPPQTVLRRFTDFNGPSPTVRYQSERNPASAYNWEIGGDYQHTFANNARFKFLFIVNDKIDESTRQRFDFQNPGDPEIPNLFLDTERGYSENIVRTSYTWNVAADHGLELGVEWAQTTQDSALRLGLPIPGERSPDFGGLTPVPLPNAVTTVEERRYEGFAIHNWRINPKMSLESSIVAEFSEIEQSGDVDNTRDFEFIKPKLDFRFDINSSFQLRLSLERDVEQLSFADFSANTNTRDEDQDTIGGNPEIAQQESWRYIANLDYRLPSDGGVLNTRLFYYDFDNVLGRIDVSPSAEEIAAVNGNVGNGRVYGLNLDASIRLGMFNLPQALLTAGVLVQESEIIDPLIGMERKVVPYDRGNKRLGFRHDVSSQNLSYGFNYRDGIDGNRPFWDIDNVLFIGSPSNLTLFVEKTGWLGFIYRLEAINAMDWEQKRERRRFEGYLRDDVLREIERFYLTDGVRFTFKIRGTF